jgi:erythromycin esterase
MEAYPEVAPYTTSVELTPEAIMTIRYALALTLLVGCAPGMGSGSAVPARDAVLAAMVPLGLPPDSADPGLIAFGREASRYPIVLLGENGHGVREHTLMKVAMVRHLHEQHGYDVLAFESGYHECREAQERLDSETVGQTIRRCLLAQFHHSDIIPLFEYIAATQRTARPLRLAGIDMQVQQFSRTRPAWLRGGLRAAGAQWADTIAVLDSILVEKSFLPADSLRAWLYPHLTGTALLYDYAAERATGDVQWALRGVSALLAREALRKTALAAGTSVPAAFYEIRDAYMARSVMRHAGGGHKVMVWLHNDHARYGHFAFGDLQVKSTGQYLRELVPGRTFSVGFLTGAGTVANNSRQPRQVALADSGSIEWYFNHTRHPAAFLSLTASRRVRDWAAREFAYSRSNEVLRITPGAAFDALVYVDSVSVPSYRIP